MAVYTAMPTPHQSQHSRIFSATSKIPTMTQYYFNCQMNTLHFIPQFKASSLSFDRVIESAKKRIELLSDERQRNLKDDLEKGLANLNSSDQLKMYLSAYGDIHRQKLMIAFEKIPSKVWTESKISVVDYGCGQCIAEMVLSDFLKKHYIDNSVVEDFILIETSKLSLIKGLEYIHLFFPECKVQTFHTRVGNLTSDHIRPYNKTVIHIFSNVLDIIDFEREHIAFLLNQDMSHNHVLVCVSPFYQENSRGKLIDEFGTMLNGMRCEFSFEKHTDEWNKPFSCQIRIYISDYY